jgi:MFS family permease
MRSYFELLTRRRAFLRVWSAELVSLIGDWFSLVAVSIVSLESPEGGVLALATSLAAHLLPQSLAAPFGGWVADRFDKRRVLIAGALVEGALTLVMLAAASAGSIALLQAALCLRSMASAVREPAAGAALPTIVDKSELRDANTLSGFTWSVALAIGMSVGGFVTASGPGVALAVDAATFAVSAFILRGLPALPPVESAAPRGFAPLGDITSAVRAGWAPEMRRSIFAFAPIALTNGAGWLELNLTGHVHAIAAGAAATVGILHAIRGVGTAIGPVTSRGLSHAALERFSDFAAVVVVVGAVGLALAPSFWLASVAAMLWGAGGGAVWMILTTEIQSSKDEEMRGRYIALAGFAFSTTMTGGAWIAAALARLGVPTSIGAVAIALTTLAGWVALRRPAPRAATASSVTG